MAKKTKQPDAQIQYDGEDMWIIFDGTKIARRGLPGTPQAMTWIVIEPGYTIRHDLATGVLEVFLHGAPVN